VNPRFSRRKSILLSANTEEGVVQNVSGEQLEMMMTEWDTPLLVDAYATWCGPCMQMAPDFESAAKEMEGRVRFCKIDTDKEEVAASRMQIAGLPTLLFLDEYRAEGEEGGSGQTALKGRIEGAYPKDMIVQLCEYFFFDGPVPEGMTE